MAGPRCFLYSADAPGGRVFEGEDAITSALKDGWVESPALVGQKAPAPKPAAKKKAKKKATKKAGGKVKATSDSK